MSIPLPESITLKRDKQGEAELYGKARAWLAKEARTPGIHASSLLDPRLAYFQKGQKEELDDRLACTFLIGKVLHAFVLSAADGATGTDWSTDTGSRTSKELGIEYSMDHFSNGVPEELKTSRKPYEPRQVKDMELYIEQVLIYMAAENSRVGKIWVLFTGLKEGSQTTPAFRCYIVEVSQEDLDATKEFIKTTVSLLNVAWERKDHTSLPNCHKFKCSPKNCQFWEQCKPEGRYPRKTRGSWKA